MNADTCSKIHWLLNDDAFSFRIVPTANSQVNFRIKEPMGLCASKSDKQDSVPSPRRTIKRVQRTVSSNAPKDKLKGTDYKLSDVPDEAKSKLTPQDAARLAAEKRLAETNEKSTKGQLGKKLASERVKAHKTSMIEQVYKQKIEKANDDIVFD